MNTTKNGFEISALPPVRKQSPEFVLTFRLTEQEQEGDFDWRKYSNILLSSSDVVLMKVYKTKLKPPYYHFVVNQTRKKKDIKVDPRNENVVESPARLLFPIGVRANCRPYYKTIKDLKFSYNNHPDYDLLETFGDYATLSKQEISFEERIRYYQTLPTPQAKKDYIKREGLEFQAYRLGLNDLVLKDLDDQIAKQANIKSKPPKSEKQQVFQDSITNLLTLESVNIDNINDFDLPEDLKPVILFQEDIIARFWKTTVTGVKNKVFFENNEALLQDNVPKFFDSRNDEYSKVLVIKYIQNTHGIALKSNKAKNATANIKLNPFLNFCCIYYNIKKGKPKTGEWYGLMEKLYGSIIPLSVKEKMETLQNK